MKIYIVDYSERAIAVFGESKPYKTFLTELGGKYNSSLTHNSEKKAGWIFPKGKRNVVEKLINDIDSGTILPEPSTSSKPRKEESKSSINEEKENQQSRNIESSSSNMNEILKHYVSKKDFMNLVSKIERLEQEISILKDNKNNSSSSSSSSQQTQNSSKKNPKLMGMIELSTKSWADEEDDEIEEEEVEEVPKKSLLRKK